MLDERRSAFFNFITRAHASPFASATVSCVLASTLTSSGLISAASAAASLARRASAFSAAAFFIFAAASARSLANFPVSESGSIEVKSCAAVYKPSIPDFTGLVAALIVLDISFTPASSAA